MVGVVRSDVDVGDLLLDHTQVLCGEVSAISEYLLQHFYYYITLIKAIKPVFSFKRKTSDAIISAWCFWSCVLYEN